MTRKVSLRMKIGFEKFNDFMVSIDGINGLWAMRFKGLDLNLLVTLDALLSQRSVTRAAEQLNLSQSAISCALGRLREHLDDDLLTQVGRRMFLTPFAETLAGEVRQLLLRIDATIKARPAFLAERATRHFRIAASDYVAHITMETLRRHVLCNAPGVSLELLPIGAQAIQKLDYGEIDLLIAPDHFINPDYSSAPLFVDEIVCLVWRDNRQVGDSISLEQYLRMEHVAFQPEGLPVTFENWLMDQFKQRNVRISTLNFTMLPHYVVGSHLVATVPLRLADYFSGILPVRVVRPEFPLVRFTETMLWHRARDKDPGLSWLRQVLSESGTGSSA